MLQVDFRFVYLLGSLAIFLFYLLLLLIRPDLRKLFAVSALLLIPFGIISEILFFKDYWYPPAFFELNFFGIRIILEDIIFSLSAPIIGAMAYVIVFNKRFSKDFTVTSQFLIKAYLLEIVLLVLFFGITLLGDINSIFSISIAAILLSIPMLYMRKDLLKPSIITAVLAAIAVFVFYYMYVILIGKEYLYSVWLLDHNAFGLNFMGSVVPLTEVLFAATLAPCFFLLLLTASDLRIKE